ncbi:MAG: BCD family MFS transporter [Pseudomonadota bacterium]
MTNAIGPQRPLSWLGVARLGLAQTALGAVTVLTIAILNRVMIVELGMAATIPAALVVFQYAVQLLRPRFGFRSDVGGRRTPWIIGGTAVLALGGIAAASAVAVMSVDRVMGVGLAVGAYLLIGLGIGAAGTTLLALLTARVAPERKPAAASMLWIMMIAGIVATAITAGQLLEPFSFERLIQVAIGIGGLAFLTATLAVWGMEPRGAASAEQTGAAEKSDFWAALAEIWADPTARRFTYFVFVSMLAYKGQDIILEPFAGEAFGYTVAESTALSGQQHAGALIGMALVAVSGWLLGGHSAQVLRILTIGGCAASAAALGGLGLVGHLEIAAGLQPAAMALGFSNGVFAVAAIASMMALASEGGRSREGVRIGVWGAAQGVAFGLGILSGAAAVDLFRLAFGAASPSYGSVFGLLAVSFLLAGALALRAVQSGAARVRVGFGDEAPAAGA